MSSKSRYETVDQYISSFPADVRKILKEVQSTIKVAVPEAEETISYQMPAFRVNGRWLFYYSAYQQHYALSCPPPFTVFGAFKEQLKPYVVSKTAIQFPLSKPVPIKLIREMAKFRAVELSQKALGKK